MHISRRDDRDAALEDLDGLALGYAATWRAAARPARGRLRDDLVRHLVPFADRLAARYRDRAEPIEDLRQVARLGLVKAVDRYDPDRGSFTAFAVSTIRGELKRHFRDNTWDVHVTRRLQDLVLRTGQADMALTGQLSRTPTNAEVAHHLGVDEDEVLQARAVARVHTAVPLATGTGHDRPEAASPADPVDGVPDRIAAGHLIRRLPPRIRHILALHFEGDLTQQQIADLYGISQMQVSRLLGQALGWLRLALLCDVPPPWTGADAADALRVRTVASASAVTVTVAGEVDRDTATRLRVALHAGLARARGKHLVVDVSGAPLIDVRGAAVLRDLGIAAALSGVRVHLTGARQYVVTVLAAVGLPASVVVGSPS